MISASLVGLALGAVPHRLTLSGELPQTDAMRLGIAVGLFGAAAAAIAGAVSAPEWAQSPRIEAAGSLIPVLHAALEPAIRVLMATAVMLPTLLTVDHFTIGWSRHRVVGALLLALVGFAAVGVPATTNSVGWLIAIAALGAALIVALRHGAALRSVDGATRRWHDDGCRRAGAWRRTRPSGCAGRRRRRCAAGLRDRLVVVQRIPQSPNARRDAGARRVERLRGL